MDEEWKGLCDVKSKDDLNKWFTSRPIEFAICIAARVAMREFPDIIWLKGNAGFRSDIVLPLFHGLIVPWFAVHRIIRNNAEVISIESVRAISRASAVVGRTGPIGLESREVSRQIVEANRVARDAADAIRTDNSADVVRAVRGCARVVSAHTKDVYLAKRLAEQYATRRDIHSLSTGRSAEKVLNMALWPSKDWIERVRTWSSLKNELLDADEGWEVWTDWYDARLRGDMPDWDKERARILIPDGLWKQGPKAVNAEIARRIAEHDDALPIDPTEAPSATDSPQGAALREIEQAALGDFRLSPEDNTLHLVPRHDERPDLAAPPIRRGFVDRVAVISLGFAELADAMQGSVQAPPYLLRTMRAYRADATVEPMEDILPGRLKWHADILRDELGDDDVRHMIGEKFVSRIGRALGEHDELMRDFYGAAMNRMESISPEFADETADPVEAAELAASLPLLVDEEAPPELPRADAELADLFNRFSADVKQRKLEIDRLEGARRSDAERRLRLQVKQIAATAIKFVREVGRGYAVDAGKLGLAGAVGWLLLRVFGVSL